MPLGLKRKETKWSFLESPPKKTELMNSSTFKYYLKSRHDDLGILEMSGGCGTTIHMTIGIAMG